MLRGVVAVQKQRTLGVAADSNEPVGEWWRVRRVGRVCGVEVASVRLVCCDIMMRRCAARGNGGELLQALADVRAAAGECGKIPPWRTAGESAKVRLIVAGLRRTKVAGRVTGVLPMWGAQPEATVAAGLPRRVVSPEF